MPARSILTRLLFVVGTTLMAVGSASAAAAAEPSEETGVADAWTRASRMSIYDSQWHVRYPSLLRTSKGDILLLFARHSAEEDQSEELVALRSADNGASWSDPRVLLTGDDCTLGAAGVLDSGKIVGLLMEARRVVKDLRLITSDDGGKSWNIETTALQFPLISVTPHGRIIEMDGVLLAPVYGIISTEDEGEESLQAGLVRSRDRGLTWGDYSPLAYDPEAGDMVYKEPVVLSAPEGLLVALAAGRSQTVPLYDTWTLFRMTSDDGGRSWTPPQAVVAGEHPCLVSLPGGGLACAEVEYEGENAWVRFQTSTDAFRTWRNYQECWSIRHFRKEAFAGRPTMLALDEDRALLAFSRTRLTGISGPHDVPRGTPVRTSCGVESDGTEIGQERIDGVVFKRGRLEGSGKQSGEVPEWKWMEDRPVFPSGTPGRLWSIMKTSAGQLWALLETGKAGGYELRTSDDNGRTWSAPSALPTDAILAKWEPQAVRPVLGAITRSGRWIIALPRTLVRKSGYTLEYLRADDNGYGVWKTYGQRWQCELYIFFSDDAGRTWQGMDSPIDTSPLNQVAHPGRILEEDDGTLVMSVWGAKTREDVDKDLGGIAMVRSHDGGATWSDASMVAYGTPEDALCFSENDFVVFPDGTWLVLARRESRLRTHQWPAATVLATSSDRGRTWSRSEQVLTDVSPQLALLPDGALVCTGRSGIYISYDRGTSWTQTGVYPKSNPIPLEDGTLALFSRRHRNTARILRRSAP